MNKCSILFLLALIFVLSNPLSLKAQKSDSISIKQVVDNYIVGWRTANPKLLEEAFDLEAGVVMWVDKNGESEQLKSMKLAELTDRSKPRESYGVGYVVQNLEIIDSQIAIAIVKIPSKNGHYIDCLELQKINDKWKIVLKSFVYFPK